MLEDEFFSVFVKFFLILVSGFIVIFIFKRVMRRILIKLEKAPSHVLRIGRFLSLSVIIFAFKILSAYFYENLTLFRILDSLAFVFLFSAIVCLTNALLDLWNNLLKKRSKGLSSGVFPVLIKLVDAVLWFLCFTIVLNVWGIKITALLAGLGVAGIAAALAIQSTLGDFFSGVALMSDNVFRIGDVVEFDGVFGKVYDVSFRSVKIKTYDNEIVTIPNSKLASSMITNHSRLRPRRFRIDFGVEYGSDVAKVKKLSLEVVKSFKEVLKDPEPYVYFSGFGDFSLNFSIRGWVKSYDDLFFTKEKIREKLYKVFSRHKISFAFPTSIVHLKK